MNKLVKTSFKNEDVKVLLQDIKGRVEILGTEEREKRIQSGTHYSEMLPLEYVPTAKYMEIYNDALDSLSKETALAVSLLGDKIMKKYNGNPVIVSLARAGTPIGILVKRYMKYKYSVDVEHYTISIIRDKGIDVCAMKYILSKHKAKDIVFLDGWVGKGTINSVLRDAVYDLVKDKVSEDINELSSEIAVLSDPAYVTELCGTHADFLIPSACLNATVCGLMSRTVKLNDMTDDEFHGAVYYEQYENDDKTYEFIDNVCKYFNKDTVFDSSVFRTIVSNSNGKSDIEQVMCDLSVEDVNLVKPGVGETTRVLLRRVPDIILIKRGADSKYLKHVIRLAQEKGVTIMEYPLNTYKVIGVIKKLADV